MSRQIRAGDLVGVQLGSQIDQYPINRIVELQIYVQTPNGEALIYPKDERWVVYGAEQVPYIISFNPMIEGQEESLETLFLTGDPYQDTNILSMLDDQSLFSACATNTYARQLCQPLCANKVKEKYDQSIFNLISNDYCLAINELDHAMDHLDSRETKREILPGKYEEYQKLVSGKIPYQKWKQLYDNYHQNLFADNYDNAIRKGKLHVLQYLYDNDIKPNPGHMGLAITSSQIDVINWMLKDGKVELPRPVMLQLPQQDGYFDLLTYLIGKNPDYLHGENSIGCLAAALGHINVLKWLAQQGYEITNVADCAAHPERIGWIETSPRTRQLNLEVIKWLHQNYGYLPSQDSINYGSKDGKNIDIIAYTEPFGVTLKLKTFGREAATKALSRYFDADVKTRNYSEQEKQEIKEEAVRHLKWLAQRGFIPTQKGKRLEEYYRLINTQ